LIITYKYLKFIPAEGGGIGVKHNILFYNSANSNFKYLWTNSN